MKQVFRNKYMMLGAILILTIIISGTYAFWGWTSPGSTDVSVLVSDVVKVIYTKGDDIEGATLKPTATKEEGITKEIKVKLKETTSLSPTIDFYLDIVSIADELKHTSFKYEILRNSTSVGSGNFSTVTNGSTLKITTTSQSVTVAEDTYTLYLWIDGNMDNPSSMSEKSFNFKLRAEGTNTSYEEGCSSKTIKPDAGVNTPNLVDGMIPIKWDECKETWVKANTTSDWYNYSEKKWANIALVNDESRASYMSASVGTEITEANILAYLVWIPRYRYQLWNASNTNQGSDEQEIQITFESTVTPPSCGGYVRNGNGYDCTGGLVPYDIKDNISNYSILGASRMYASATDETWLTHPAFRFGEKELDGIWVGKFETTGNTTTPTIKPNQVSLLHITPSVHFNAISKFKTSISYGINTSEIDSHMMKNIEWGAVAYLSHSKYGMNSEIYINPSDSYITGRSGNTVSQSSTTDTSGVASTNLYGYDGSNCDTKTGNVCTGAKQTTFGMAASTTGNIYGIYDMSGGGFDYVMGHTSSSASYNSHTMDTGSGGTSFIASNNTTYNNITLPKKYYDIYNNGSSKEYNRGIIGDATKETLKTYGSTSSGWYSDYPYFLSENTWFVRGGDILGVGFSGTFRFDVSHGDYEYGIYPTSRVVFTK